MTKAIVSKLSVGDKVGRLTILEIIPGSRTRRDPKLTIHKKVKCICDCGIECVKHYGHVRTKKTISCGCFRVELNTTHGLAHIPEYSAWEHVKGRCLNSRDKEYKNYGGRGITICDRWKGSFKNFFDDMKSRPSETHSIDRINNDGNYEPSNCKWSTPKEQANNRRRRTPC